MPAERLVPLLWPAEGLDWALLEASPVNCVLTSEAAVASEARRRKLTAYEPDKAPAIVVRDAVWPRIPIASKQEPVSVETGPTGAPWVESNGWRVTLARTKNPGKPVWVSATPPAITRAEAFSVAIADAAMTGGQWIVSLDDGLAKGMRAKETAALATWKTIATSLRFFEDRAAWGEQPTNARLGIISDFTGFVAKEALNLATRRHLQYRAFETSAFPSTVVGGLTALLWLDARPPDASLLEYARPSRLVVVPSSAAKITEGLEASGERDGYALFKIGMGRIARALKPWTDPYLLITEVHRLMSRANDTIRMFNAGSTNVRYSEAGVVQIVNYAARPAAHPMSLWVAKPYTKAQWTTLAGETKTLAVESKSGGSEVALPAFTSYAAVEFGE